METKICPRCHKEIPVSGFYKNSSAKDGFDSMCKECRSKCQKEYYSMKSQHNSPNGGGNPELSRFTPRQLIEELRARGYTGELKYVQTIKL